MPFGDCTGSDARLHSLGVHVALGPVAS